MPWCPKCKNEYREGITVCADCGEPLVDDIEEAEELEMVFATPEREMAERFIEFLKYSKIQSGIIKTGEEGEYMVSVRKHDFKQAKKLFQGFVIAESENAMTKELEKMQATGEQPKILEEGEELSEEELAQMAESTEFFDVEEGDVQKEEESEFRGPAKVYTKQEDKYKDLNSTAYTFLIVGILGLIFVAANALGVLSIIKNMLAGVLYTVIFAGCIFVAFQSFKDAKKAKAQIQDEENLTEQVKKWLEENISEETFTEVVDESLGDEANYLNKLEYMSKLVTKEFPQLDVDYADQLCEEFYGEKFD